ncbi:MAG: hypothetical protein JXB23_03205 [Candidatus Aminicenantes bacterium]|nr:hypothetical protein [Candidatus Aminicenantes bacterium]
MRSKKTAIVIIGILILFTALTFAETKKLKQIGRYTLVRIKGEVPTGEVMKILVEQYAGDIKYGFDLAGYGDVFLPFLDQLKTASFEDAELPVGQEFMWMLFRSRGKVKLVEDLEWAGETPLPVYIFKVKKNFKHYTFIIPKPCGNVALIKVEEIIPDAVCAISVSPAKANINDPISVDMSGSQHAKSMEVEVLDGQGNRVGSKTLTPDSPKWQTKFDKPGEYVFKGKAINIKDIASANPCEAKTYINAPPTCELTTSCSPCKNYVGRPVTIDASGSSDPDGQVAKADFQIADEAGNQVDSYSSTSSPFTWEKIFDKPGVYAITLVVTDDFGAMSEPCKVELEITEKRLFALVDAGPLEARGSHGNYLFGRVGLLYYLVPKQFSLIVEGGGAFPVNHTDVWKTFALANFSLNYHAGPFYIGAGAGYATKVKEERDGDVFLLGNIGYQIFDNWNTAGSIFFATHFPIGEGREFSKHHKFVLGFRLLF